MSGAGPHLGIDLGTTNCVAAYADASGALRSVVNFEGDILTPSAVLFEDEQTILVGREALKQAVSRPEAYLECFKREVGAEHCARRVQGTAFRPEFLSAVLLRRLKADFERTLGAARGAVITVPAYFDESRRRATRNAGIIAGWEVTDIINEPTAAALAFAHGREGLASATGATRRILIYDLGGGTFDCTLLEISPRSEYRTIATDGEVRLGGVDWDHRLSDYLAAQFQKKTGVAPLGSPSGAAAFLRLARQMKHDLTARSSAERPVTFEGKRALLEVKREAFEGLTADLLDRTRTTTRLVLDAARLTWREMDAVVLIGGSSRMPMVARMLEAESGRKPDTSASLDEAVAHGAALYAHLLGTASPVRIVNVNSHSLRIVGRKEHRRLAREMIPRNSPLPSSRTKLFPVAQAGQRSVMVEICEGECDDPELCEAIGQVKVTGLPDGDKAWKVAVTLKYLPDGSVDVAASVFDPDNMAAPVKSASATLIPSRGLTPELIERERSQLAKFRIA